MAFMFGLLHGLGFAGALADIGLPEDNLWISLLLFNIGIEVRPNSGNIFAHDLPGGSAQLPRTRPFQQRSWLRGCFAFFGLLIELFSFSFFLYGWSREGTPSQPRQDGQLYL